MNMTQKIYPISYRSTLLAMLLLAIGLVILPNIARAAVTIDQAPLTVRGQIAPNIVLMLDDSGSMSWEFMPDWKFIADGSSSDACDDYENPGDPDELNDVDDLNSRDDLNALRNPKINGVYYSPNVEYSPPPKADGSFYPASPSLAAAYRNGFGNLTDTQDVTRYCANDPIYNGSQERGHNFRFYTAIQSQDFTTGSYDPTPGCAPGDWLHDDGENEGKCHHEGGRVTTYYEPDWDRRNECYKDRDDDLTHRYPDPPNSGGDREWHRHQLCRHRGYTSTSHYDPTLDYGYCKQGDLDSDTGKCIVTERKTAYLFTYTSKDSSGNAIQHFIGKNQQDCDIALSDPDYPNASCDYTLETRQNVANWFSYYRTRILMAKSGLMSAFSGMDQSYRFGFSSINQNNDDGLPGNSASYGPTTSNDNRKIANVTPFGNGTAATQKASFWAWLEDEQPNGSTPLREALQAVGEYYKTKGPWESTSSDGSTTELLACRQSYTILTTDGMWNSGKTNVDNADGNDGPLIKGTNGQRDQYLAVAPFKDNASATLADVALHYWANDLAAGETYTYYKDGSGITVTPPAIANGVPTSTADSAFWQHMVTFTIGMGFLPPYNSNSSSTDPKLTTGMVDALFKWSQNPSGAKPAELSDWAGWLTPRDSSSEINNISDLVHAGINGHGGFYSATDPQSFANSLQDALHRTATRVGTGASLAANSTRLDTGTVTYQAFYHTTVWSGDLKAFNVDPDSGQIANNPNWSAASKLPAADNRVIYTYNPGSQQIVEFNSASTLSAAQQTALGSTSAEQQAVIDYLRGDRSQEEQNGGDYRNRKTALGDIVSSQPVFTGAPTAGLFSNQTFNGAGSYSTYVASQSSVTPVIWVAANDGMLHGFNALTGTEVYAYLPATVITSGIAKLADPEYGNSVPHEYFNDGELTVADAYINNSWSTILVGTSGRGTAKTLYALDVTDPSNIQFLWERAAGDGQSGSSFVGQIASKPIVAQTADGTWSVLVGNGYNSNSGTAALLQFDLATGALTTYATNATTDNGLASPAVWAGNPQNGISTVAFAGDLAGNVWAFDLTTPGNSGTLLYSAKDAGGKAQPITGGMLAAKDPKTDNLWLFFGTGSYLNQTDLADKSVQTWYGIIVKQPNVAQSTTITQLAAGRSALRQRTIIAEEAPNPDSTPPTLGGRAISTPTENDMDGKLGWYIDLVSPNAGAQGERMTTPNQFHGNLLIGNSRIPESSDPCNPSGKSWIMALDPFTGAAPDAPFFDLNNDGNFDDDDKITHDGISYVSIAVGFSSVANNPIFVGNRMLTDFDDSSNSTIDTNQRAPFGTPDRLSWRELVNH